MNLRIRFGIALGALLPATAGGQVIDEYQVKAAFIYNFAKFVEWPPQTFKSPGDPMSICVLGQNPFGSSLEEAVNGKSVDGRRFAVRQVADMQQAGGCQISVCPIGPAEAPGGDGHGRSSDSWRNRILRVRGRSDQVQARRGKVRLRGECGRGGAKPSFASAPSF